MPVNANWESLILTAPSGSAIAKNAGNGSFYNASALTQQAIAGNGYVEFTAPQNLTDECAIGLGNDATANLAVGMSHALAFPGSTNGIVLEAGAWKADFTWVPGDVFKIEVFTDGANKKVRYVKNGAEAFYTSATTVTATLPLKVDVIIKTLNAGFTAVTLDGVAAGNQAPVVDAGSDVSVAVGATATLSGSATDDGLPGGSTLSSTWSVVNGPGSVTFANANAASTTATFAVVGTYVLRLTATDGTLSSSDDVSITVTAASSAAEYDLVFDLAVRQLPELPLIGAAGSKIIEPTYRTPLWRVTDQNTQNGASFGTPGAPNTSQWARDSSAFYAPSDDGSTYVVYTFDPSGPSWVEERRLTFGNEPTFARSTSKPHILYGPTTSNAMRLGAFNRTTGVRSVVYDLRTDVPDLTVYQGPIYSSDNDWIACPFEGIQNTWKYVTAVNVADTAQRVTLDTRLSRIKVNGGAWTTALKHDGTPANLNFGMHSIAMDHTGTYVRLDPPANESGPWITYWLNIVTNRIHISDTLAANGGDSTMGGHYYVGPMQNINCIAPAGSDQPQWLRRDLTQGGGFPVYARLINPAVIPPNNEDFTDHQSWHNALPGSLVPFLSGTQRGAASFLTGPWLPTQDELVLVPSDPVAGGGSAVYRVCHHRIHCFDANNVNNGTFRDSPRPQISPDGRWGLFTTNWGQTLGTLGNGTSNHRRDLFLVRLQREALVVPGVPSAPTPANNAVDVPVSTTLEFTGGSAASLHDIYMGTSNPPTALVASQVPTSFSPPTLEADTQYFWRAVAKNSQGQTDGPVWNFTTVDDPDPGPGPGGLPLPAIIRTVSNIKRTITFITERA